MTKYSPQWNIIAILLCIPISVIRRFTYTVTDYIAMIFNVFETIVTSHALYITIMHNIGNLNISLLIWQSDIIRSYRTDCNAENYHSVWRETHDASDKTITSVLLFSICIGTSITYHLIRLAAIPFRSSKLSLFYIYSVEIYRLFLYLPGDQCYR